MIELMIILIAGLACGAAVILGTLGTFKFLSEYTPVKLDTHRKCVYSRRGNNLMAKFADIDYVGIVVITHRRNSPLYEIWLYLDKRRLFISSGWNEVYASNAAAEIASTIDKPVKAIRINR